MILLINLENILVQFLKRNLTKEKQKDLRKKERKFVKTKKKHKGSVKKSSDSQSLKLKLLMRTRANRVKTNRYQQLTLTIL